MPALDYYPVNGSSGTLLIATAHGDLSQNNITLLILILIILIGISALVSGSQTALFSLNPRDLNMLRVKQNKNARLTALLLENPRLLQASLVIIGLLTNLGFIFIADFLIDQLVSFRESFIISLGIKILLITSVLVLIGQVMPRVYAAHNAIRMALFSAPFIRVLCRMIAPVSRLYEASSGAMERKMTPDDSAGHHFEQIDEVMDSTVSQSATEEERNILKGIVEFGNITVKQIMRGRLDVSGISHDSGLEEVIRQVSELHYSRLPVYEGSLDNIKGMIHTKDLLPFLESPGDGNWHTLVKPPFFVHEQKLIEDLLREFQSRHIHFAIVVDEFGGTSGIVTLEDILEEIIGDIRDEFDEEDPGFSKIDAHTYVFDGKMMLNDVCRVFNIPPETFEAVRGDSDSLGGLILELAGEFPEPQRVISYENFEFTVLDVTRMRIRKVKMTIKGGLMENN
ncbi:MAG TPA: gliding motility-associated protein GldE [Chitinophagaceae bacterium]|nr:gliding motility-associated protein GldE [Chitinophagaceae bacterium]